MYVCVRVHEVRRATMEDVAGCHMLMQAAHGGNVGRSNRFMMQSLMVKMFMAATCM